MARFRYVVVDVFTDTPLAGNQLAVFTDARDIPEEMLQRLAREMNFSETTFCYPSRWPNPARQPRSRDETASQAAVGHENDSETTFIYPPEAGGHVKMRIFTPRNEVPFAGHPTLGTAFVLGGPLQLEEIRIETGRGIVPVALERDGPRIVFGRMAQPLPSIEPFAAAAELQAALGVESRLPVERYDNGIAHVFVTFASEAEVAALAPDQQRLAAAGHVAINCIAGSGTRWKSRMFAPAHGVAEDPATGSAAGPLALHLARHGEIAFGDEIEISQGAEIGRPSTLYARVYGSADAVERIEVGGSAVVVARGEFRLP
jgi:trans-2,3-dihydro-3-hydroxyanthranilate isomerase